MEGRDRLWNRPEQAASAMIRSLMLPEYGMTSAEITMEEKNAISHRGKALRAMKKRLGAVL